MWFSSQGSSELLIWISKNGIGNDTPRYLESQTSLFSMGHTGGWTACTSPPHLLFCSLQAPSSILEASLTAFPQSLRGDSHGPSNTGHKVNNWFHQEYPAVNRAPGQAGLGAQGTGTIQEQKVSCVSCQQGPELLIHKLPGGTRSLVQLWVLLFWHYYQVFGPPAQHGRTLEGTETWLLGTHSFNLPAMA